MHPISIVFRKEIKDGRRDRRSLMSAFFFPILAPVLVYGMMTAIINIRTSAEQKVIPIVGMENAPTFIKWLKEQDVKVETFTGDPRQAIVDKKEELVVIIPDNYQKKFSESKTAAIEIVNDGSRTDAAATVRHFKDLVRRYNAGIASLRMIARGVSPEVIRVVIAEDIDVASKQQRAAAALNFIPMYIIMSAFVCGMGIAIDTTAGERERKTLEPLLINPVERHEIVIGKWLASSVFAATGMVMTLVLCILALAQVPLGEIGLNFHVTGSQILLMIVATLPLAFLATSMQLLLGIFAKSFKDAQSYIGLLMLIPMVPSLYLTFSPIATQDWMFAVPMLGQHILVVDVLGAKEVPAMAYVYSALSGIVLGLALVLVTARLFQKESIIRA
ncbi:MAG: ABC transporter permease [bacterium]|nr:ABC transporter permease [Gammaproteobacteria bacterium]